ncbi:MAG: rhomboid family intramembrane serine protease [Anaerolineaceae bacterium]|nr:rhomboid family intramembrane serine protease [Anaerolineaceae bacterium]
MIPIRDDIPARRVPVINYLLITLNILVFVFLFLSGPAQEALVYEFALIPLNYSNGLELGDLTDIFTSMFMHAGLLHLVGNMLYLWIFGDNVEDTLGSIRYLAFYLVGGMVGSLSHFLTNPGSQLPTVGASGAIAAVLGAYLVLYPRARIATFIPIGFFLRLTMMPASIVLGLWFVLQLFSGVLSFGAADMGGTAFWAHIGGFVFGVLIGFLAKSMRRQESVITW